MRTVSLFLVLVFLVGSADAALITHRFETPNMLDAGTLTPSGRSSNWSVTLDSDLWTIIDASLEVDGLFFGGSRVSSNFSKADWSYNPTISSWESNVPALLFFGNANVTYHLELGVAEIPVREEQNPILTFPNDINRAWFLTEFKQSSSSSFILNSKHVHSEITTVPEPAPLALLVLGLCFVWALKGVRGSMYPPRIECRLSSSA